MAIIPPAGRREIPIYASALIPGKKDEEGAKISALINHVEFNKKERNQKIDTLTGQYKNDALNFEKEIKELNEGLFSELTKLNRKILDKKKPSVHDKEKFEKLAGEIRKRIENLESRYEKYNIFTDFLRVLVNINKTEDGDFLFSVEATLTSAINSIHYYQQVERFVIAQKKEIIEKFFSKEEARNNSDLITFHIDLSKGETHNGGKNPAFVIFSRDQKELFKVVYKPRNAEIDIAVIRTFRRINKLDDDNKSDKSPLPFYKIWSFPDESIWEYVEGQDVDDPDSRNVAIFIDKHIEPDRREKTRRALYRLDAILRRMCISDLHKANVKIKFLNDKSKDVEIIPIDLENRQQGQGTLLGVDSRAFKLTPAEEQKIDKYFTKKVNTVPVRYLPLTTEVMMGLIGDFRQCEQLAKQIMDRFNDDKLQVKCTTGQLTTYLYKSLLAHDIPYFTNKDGNIYYGLQRDGILLATGGNI